MTDKLWVKRRYEPEDEDGIVYLWLKSYAHARVNTATGAHIDASPAERTYWAEHAFVVERLLRTSKVELLCDPQRPYASAAGPAIIYAFACTDGPDVVHYLCVKRNYAREGFGPDMVADLLGDRLKRPCVYTHELPEMRATKDRSASCGVALPMNWRHDPWWCARMWSESERAA